jgi:OOP family OmpA-OmpF porin
MHPEERPDSAPPERAGNGTGGRRSPEFAQLRELLLGPERRRLEELADQVDAIGLTAEEMAERLPEAIALRASRDHQLGRALAPTIETALRESIRRNPREIATAIFPVLGPAIRKAISETMANLVRSINAAVEHSLSVQGIKWRVEAWRSGTPYADVVIKHSLVYRVEQVFLIHAESGLLLAHVSARDLRIPDADLISSMLSAIQDFVRDSFRPEEGATLRTFTVGEHTVHVEAGPGALLAAVIRGHAPESVTGRLQTTLETIHREFASPLAHFTGDDAPFAPARPLLEECLETVVATRPSSGKVWLRWAVPLAAAVLLAVSLTIWSSVRWRRAVRLLDAEPGLVVVDASRGWRTWRFRGLRDPMARDPATVLAAAGLAPRALSGEWEPYLSLDADMVARRRERALSALEPLRQRIESQRILFEPGSAQLSPEASATVRRVAGAVRDLIDGATAAGARVRVALQGRTDGSGSDATNQFLAQRRIDSVAAHLSSAGVVAELLVREAIATSQPLSAPTDEERSRINRSVSFALTIGTGPQAPRER